MKIAFTKFHGTGNDFIIIDDRRGRIAKKLSPKIVEKLCVRRFGIGADGLILLQSHRKADFKMKYFNADGKESSMCGNGGRCLVKFAYSLKLFKNTCSFEAIDGLHQAKIENSLVHLKMSDVPELNRRRKDIVLDTGSPHFIRFVKDVSAVDVLKSGQGIRYNKTFSKEGINVNFVELHKKGIRVATYERGVENETYSCGTGVVAASLATHFTQKLKTKKINVLTKGGKLRVRFTPSDGGYSDIWLIGPAEKVNEGVFEI